MDECALKVRVGEHEFEARGPVELVKAQFEAFKDLVAKVSRQAAECGAFPDGHMASDAQLLDRRSVDLNVDRVFRATGRVVSLTAPPASETDAVLLVLYGQRHYRDNENVTGSELMDGMQQSGYKTPRIDRILTGLAREGAVLVSGSHRSKKYRLTNPGHARTESILREVLANLP